MYVWAATTALGVMFAVPEAYAFSRFCVQGRNLLFYTVLVHTMFSALVSLIPPFILMRWLALVTTRSSLIPAYLVFVLPLSIRLLEGFHDDLPPQLEQVTRIRGATRFATFLCVVVPLSHRASSPPLSTPSSSPGTSISMRSPSSTTDRSSPHPWGCRTSSPVTVPTGRVSWPPRSSRACRWWRCSSSFRRTSCARSPRVQSSLARAAARGTNSRS